VFIAVVNVRACIELSQQMALEKLRESMRCRQHTMLKQAIWDCERFDRLKENKEVRNANRTLAVIEARQGDHLLLHRDANHPRLSFISS